MRRSVMTVLLGALCLAWTSVEPATAEPCAGPNDRPAVCRVEFYGALAGQRLSPFEPDRGIDLPPGQTLQIELEARDQNRYRFPGERLAFHFDADDCRGLVDVRERAMGRFDLRATGRQGRCDLWMWVPGNLNLEWRLDLRITPRERTGYARNEAEFITQRLYRALLGREPEPQALRDTSAEIERGNLAGRTLDMLRSPEFQRKSVGRRPTALLEQIYAGIFDRKPDPDGVQAFLPLLQRGQTAIVIRELLESEEFERLLSDTKLGR